MFTGLKIPLADMVSWRHDFHRHPETACSETRTAARIADLLTSFDITTVREVGGTGVVGTLKVGTSPRAIALRADMDALPIQEANRFDHRSRHPNRMHACGHDGHAAMLLGAAQHLATSQRFDGSVHFLFQPAEETVQGAKAMVREGIFQRFATDAIFGMHNWPGLPVGHFATRTGPLMAAQDRFELKIRGRGGHAALPHQAIDPIVAASLLATALQTIVSRTLSPLENGVVSITRFHAGEAWNVIPDQAVIGGTIRHLEPNSGVTIHRALKRLSDGIAAAHGVAVDLHIQTGCPAVINTPAETAIAIAAARLATGKAGVTENCIPVMASEDFAVFLQEKPGNYLFIGNGNTGSGCTLHNPHYDFNDRILPMGVAYWIRLVEQALPTPGQ